MPALDFPPSPLLGAVWPDTGVAKWRYAGSGVWRSLSSVTTASAPTVLSGTSPPVNGTTGALFLGQLYIQGEAEAYVCVRLSPSVWKRMTGSISAVPGEAILYNGSPILYNGSPILYTPTP